MRCSIPARACKLERYGAYRITRPEAQALWTPRLSPAEWEAADAHFVGIGEDEADGRWRYGSRSARPGRWSMTASPSSAASPAFRHVGVFPEQATHWAG